MQTWPAVVAEEGLDPLPLKDLEPVSAGSCPWACANISFLTLVGLSTLTIDPAAVTCRAQRCDASAPVVEMSIPIVLSVLQASVVAQAQLTGLPVTLRPVVDFGPARGHVRVRLPFSTTGFLGLTALLDVAHADVDVYVNLERVTHAQNVPPGLFNAVLNTGLKNKLSALLHAKVSTLVTNIVRRTAPSQAVSFSAALIPGFFDPAPPPAPLQACAGVASSNSSASSSDGGGDCAPCDTCCACAAQERCADPACSACGACMPATACATSVSWKLWAAGAGAVVVVLVLLAAVSFVAVLFVTACWGIGKGLYHAVPVPKSLDLGAGTGIAIGTETAVTFADLGGWDPMVPLDL
jgi:hypothetical protein